MFWPCGGIGRHVALRMLCRKAWGFESLQGHLLNSLVAELVDALPLAGAFRGSSPLLTTVLKTTITQ